MKLFSGNVKLARMKVNLFPAERTALDSRNFITFMIIVW